MSSSDSTASYAAEVARLLWPAPWEAPYVTRAPHRTGQAHRDAYIFPSERRPRLLVPADLPASASMLHRLGSGRSPFVDPVRAVLERSVRSPMFPHARWPMLRVRAGGGSADSIERHLACCFGTEVRVGVLLGTRRVNQKPVLQVFDLHGRLLGYAKVGTNALTSALVRREAEALAMLAEHGPRSFHAPRLLHHDRWSGLEVLVISPLATDPRRRVPPAVRMAAMREVAHLTGTSRPRLAESAFWTRIRDSVERLADEPDGPRLVAATRRVEASHGSKPVCLGGSHGDWGRWNMGLGEGGLMLWDWERFDPEVPVGFDGLHFDAQSVRPGTRNHRRQERAFLGSASSTLSRFGVDPADHDLTLRLYLLEMAVRYVAALTHGETPPLRRRASWVLSLLDRLAPLPGPAPTEGQP